MDVSCDWRARSGFSLGPGPSGFLFLRRCDGPDWEAPWVCAGPRPCGLARSRGRGPACPSQETGTDPMSSQAWGRLWEWTSGLLGEPGPGSPPGVDDSGLLSVPQAGGVKGWNRRPTSGERVRPGGSPGKAHAPGALGGTQRSSHAQLRRGPTWAAMLPKHALRRSSRDHGVRPRGLPPGWDKPSSDLGLLA